MQLTLSNGGHGTVKVERRSPEGELLASEADTFKRDAAFRRVAAKFGVDPAALTRAVDGWRRAGGGGEQAVDLPPEGGAAVEPLAVTLRGRHQPAEQGTVFPTLREALDAPCVYPEPIAHWKGADRLCMVDADLHAGDYKLTDASAAWLAGRVKPLPLAHWRTHGGGLRLVYEAREPFSAKELAGVAALAVRALEPLCSVELKTVTRHPHHPLPDGRACGPVTWGTQTADTKALAAWLGQLEADDDAVSAYLAEHSLEVGRRYAHERCPVAGWDAAGREPVCVRDGGIYCHACAGRGVCRGSTTPGWFPFGALCGGLLPTPLRTAIAHCVHWEHARFLVAEYAGLGGEVGRACYSAALVCGGTDRRLVGAAFRAGRNIVRFDGYWATLTGQTYSKDLRPILGRLPACCHTDADGVHTDPELVARFEQPIDLADYGYAPLLPVWGIRLSGRLGVGGRVDAGVPIVLQTPDLTPLGAEPLRPRYVPAQKRGDEAAAWAVLERPFPGLNRAAVRLLIAARGCMEARQGMPPFVFISGPSGAAKSSLVQIAAAVCGDTSTTVPWQGSAERLRQGIHKAKDRGSFAVFNEYLKDSAKSNRSPVSAMDFLLTLTSDSTSHKLFIGPVPLGTVPVCVWTDTSIPAEVKQDRQIARRVVHVELTETLEAWRAAMPTYGLNTPADVRVASQEFADACNVILSGVMDEFFSAPATFQDIAGQLGFSTLEASQESREGHDALRELFALACQSPAPAGADAKRWPGRGWRVVTREQQTDLAEAWRQVCDEDFKSSRRCTEVDWARLLDLPRPVAFELRAHGGRVAFRWIRRRGHADYDATEELNTPLNTECWNLVIPEATNGL